MTVTEVKSCPGTTNQILRFDLVARPFNKSSEIISGHISNYMTLDNDVMVTVTRMRMENGEWIAERVYVNQATFCNVMQVLLGDGYQTAECPVEAGEYDVKDFKPDGLYTLFGHNMYGHTELEIKLTKADKMLSCYYVGLLTHP